MQAGFVVRMEGGHLSAALQDSLPDYELAFEDSSGQVPAFFYTCRRTAQLNEEYGDLLAIINDYEVGRGQVMHDQQTALWTMNLPSDAA